MHTLVLYIARNKEFLVTSLVVMISLLFLGYFKENSQVSPALQGLIVGIAVFFGYPPALL